MSKTPYTAIAVDSHEQGPALKSPMPFLPCVEEIALRYNKSVPSLAGGNEESLDVVRNGRLWTVGQERMRVIKLLFMEALKEHVGVRKGGPRGAWNLYAAVLKKSVLIEAIEALSEMLTRIPSNDATQEDVVKILSAGMYEFGGLCLRPSDADSNALVAMQSMYGLLAFMALQLQTLHPDPKDGGHLCGYWAALGQPPTKPFLGKAFAYKGISHTHQHLPHGGPMPTRKTLVDPAWLRSDTCLCAMAAPMIGNQGGHYYVYNKSFLDGEGPQVLCRAFRDLLSCTLAELRATLDMASLMQGKIMGGLATAALTAMSILNKQQGDHTSC